MKNYSKFASSLVIAAIILNLSVPFTILAANNNETIDFCHAPSGDLDKAKKFLDQSLGSWNGHDDHNGDFIITNQADENLCDAIIAQTACANFVDDDADGLIDALDPGCWTNPNDPNTYNPADTDETHTVVPPPTVGSLLVNKVAVGGNDIFSFTGTNLSPFNITTVQGAGSHLIENILAGVYSVTEGILGTGWAKTGDTCQNVQVVAGNQAECTVTNTFTPVPPPVDICPNVTGIQTSGVCADQTCTLGGGVWSTPNQSCDFPPPPTTEVTIVASKIVCENEASLPNWGNGGPNIDADTAEDWVASHEGCSLVQGWQFEWAPNTAGNPGDNTGINGGVWTLFGPTNVSGVASTIVPFTNPLIWLREVVKNTHIPFTGISGSDVSAEFYCHADVLNYDNFDFIDNLQDDATYYCVAFNVLKPVVPPPPVDACPLDNGFQATGPCQSDDVCPNDEGVQIDTNQCTQPPVDVCANIEGNQSSVPQGYHADGANCVADTVTPPVDNNNNSGGNGGGGGGGGGLGGGHRRDISGLFGSGEVLGASVGPNEECEPYLKEYIKLGANNNPEEVKKLQIFINQFFETNIPVTGIYGQTTFDWVKKFQQHQDDAILVPWTNAGLPTNGPTGYVYKTTKRWINILKCPEMILNTPVPALP